MIGYMVEHLVHGLLVFDIHIEGTIVWRSLFPELEQFLKLLFLEWIVDIVCLFLHAETDVEDDVYLSIGCDRFHEQGVQVHLALLETFSRLIGVDDVQDDICRYTFQVTGPELTVIKVTTDVP